MRRASCDLSQPHSRRLETLLEGKGENTLSFIENSASAEASLQEAFNRLQQAEHLHRQRKFDEARTICESLIQRHPNYVGALYRLGLIYRDQDQNEYALDCLARAAMLSPRHQLVLAALGAIYLRLGANAMAARTLAQANETKPPNSDALLMLGDIYQEDCEYELARDVYRQALAIDPGLVSASIGLGWCCYYLGEHAEAARIFEHLITQGVRLLEPIRALTVLPVSVVKIDVLAHLENVVTEPGENKTEFEISLEFFRAIALDRLGRHVEAWEHFRRANRNAFRMVEDRIGQFALRWRTSIDRLTARQGSRGRAGDAGQPISLFILGPSRSGKTSIEQLVGRMAGVKRGYENSIVRDAVRRTFEASSLLTSSSLELLPPSLYPLCRDYYREELAHKAGSAKVFTNTTPAHIHIAGLMTEVLPNIRFMFLKRNVEDNLLRIYMARYRSGNAYAYELKAARDHILHYHAMFDLMADKFPDMVRVINYDDMVANPAAVQSLAAELCGLQIPSDAPTSIHHDAGCSAPYRQLIEAELRG